MHSINAELLLNQMHLLQLVESYMIVERKNAEANDDKSKSGKKEKNVTHVTATTDFFIRALRQVLALDFI